MNQLTCYAHEQLYMMVRELIYRKLSQLMTFIVPLR